MQAIENAAYVSVGRACGFAGLAIFLIIFGLSFEPALAARTGGELCLAVTVILSTYALRARSRPYKKTELWLILPKKERPPAEIAQQLIGNTLRETYFWFALQSVLLAIFLLVAAVLLQIADVPGLTRAPR